MAGITQYKGIATDATYLYQAVYKSDFSGEYYYIARTDLVTKTRAYDWKEVTEGTAMTSLQDLCGDASYLYALYNNNLVKKFNYSGVYQTEISLTGSLDKVFSDGVYFYVYNSSAVDIYTVAGSFLLTISVADIKSMVSDNENIYISTTSKIKKYNFSGVFQSEFDHSIINIVDSIII